MSVKMTLDIPALMSLFPEGSEARVGLTKAACANVAASVGLKHLAPEVVEQLRKDVVNNVNVHLAETLKELVGTRYWNFSDGGRLSLTPAGSNALREALRESIRAEMAAVVEEERAKMVAEVLAETREAVKERVAAQVKTSVGLMARKDFDERLQKVLESMSDQG